MRNLALSAIVASAFAVAAPTHAATVISCGGNCLSGVQAVNLDQASNVTIGTGSIPGTGGIVQFTSGEPNFNLSNGAAQITSAVDALLNSLTFTVLNPTAFTQATFNLQQQGSGTNAVTISTTNSAGVTTTSSGLTTGAGANNFLISSTGNELLKSVTFTSNAV